MCVCVAKLVYEHEEGGRERSEEVSGNRKASRDSSRFSSNNFFRFKTNVIHFLCRKYFCGVSAQLSEGQNKTQRKGPRMWVGAAAGKT